MNYKKMMQINEIIELLKNIRINTSGKCDNIEIFDYWWDENDREILNWRKVELTFKQLLLNISNSKKYRISLSEEL